MSPTPEDFEAARDDRARQLIERDAVERLFAADHTLWGAEPTECANRLGWVDEPARQREAGAAHIAIRAATDAIDEIVWCGMGGSSLFPELIARSPVPRRPSPDFTVLDSSHPAPVARILARPRSDRRLYVVASKSGGTIETRSHLETLTAADPAAAVAVVTDAGSELDELAADRGWTTWHANPDIGGRFSAFSTFGMAATLLVGVDPAALIEPAIEMNELTRAHPAEGAVGLATFLAAAHAVGRDKLTLLTPQSLDGFGAWVEQLVAESTGKSGVGLLPVVDESPAAADRYGPDRCFVTYGAVSGVEAIRADGHPVFDLGPIAAAGQLGAELQRWMLATALIGVLLEINPFDQPDVESAKRSARSVLEGAAADSPPIGDPAFLLAGVGAGDHVVLQAFVDPEGDTPMQLAALRTRLRDRLGCAVTVGIGPRYLHSSGQLHKGGPNSGVFIQIVETGDVDVAIPGRGYGFAKLLRAQADGDYAALSAAGRRIVRASLASVLACV